MDTLITLEDEIAVLKAERETLVQNVAKASGATPTAEMLDRIKATRNAMSSDDFETRRDARIKVNDAMRNIINSIQCDARGHSMVSVANGLVAFEVDTKGTVVQFYDHTQDRRVVLALATREMEGNQARVKAIIKRSESA